MFSNAKLQQ
jgi:hypothetical protein